MAKMMFGGFAALMLVAVPASAATVQTLSGSVANAANASIQGNSGSTPGYSEWLATPTALGISGGVAPSGTNGGTVLAYSSAAATWGAGGTSGTINLGNGWNFQANPGDEPTAASFGGGQWTYNFTALSNATLTLNYDIVGSGSTFGLQGYTFNFNGSGTNLSVLGGASYILDPTASGSVAFALNAGQNYLISLSSGGNISCNCALNGVAGSMTGEFSFAITGGAVPEPANWALMIGGFGVVGFAARRRRSDALTA